MSKPLHQAGAIPFRRLKSGPELLLITSRETTRWVIPKGNIERGQTPRQAAEAEAFEEAGVKGIIHETPLGTYSYNKRMAAGPPQPACVEVYLLEVTKLVRRWPERAEREAEWMHPEIAAALVDEPGLKNLLLRAGAAAAAVAAPLAIRPAARRHPAGSKSPNHHGNGAIHAALGPAGLDGNLEIALRFFDEAVNQRDLGSFNRYVADNFVDHNGPRGRPADREAGRAWVARMHALFPDLKVKVSDAVAHGDKVFARNVFSGTNRRTGETIECQGFVMWRLEDRKIAERWASFTPIHTLAG